MQKNVERLMQNIDSMIQLVENLSEVCDFGMGLEENKELSKLLKSSKKIVKKMKGLAWEKH